MNHWAAYRWDPEAEGPDGLDGNFVEIGDDQLGRVDVRIAVRRSGAVLRAGRPWPRERRHG